ncbi:MAG: cytochrome c family protein [Acidobacteriia bacterium]|nr:cytochrome c family protein [Terriglobia bacterium]
MAQIFHRSTNILSRLTIYGAVFILAGLVWAAYIIYSSPYFTEVNVARQQPVPFSHKHHVSGLGLDCRFCHTSVEESSFAGIPPTETCMTCHSQIWSDSPMLEPVRASYRNNTSLEWTRVYQLPGYAYFNHSIHLNKGIGCSTCHGRVDRMPLTARENPMQMQWCLDCHRNVERYVRPREDVFKMDYVPPRDQLALGEKLVKEYKIQKLTDCTTCHR